ncbi:helix-turn-helix domain-containing protein [Streptomyces sp. NPDC047315]|uniref:TetR/AcrR family transcriptional regulator n=1 Tax=Streptomyces sp. NPDC047315 TaxID=3155142 RepID=UPI0033F1811A
MATRRPPNRKAQIRATAAELFLQHGYHNVSVTDVADELGITASALYHHYRNKQDLLLNAVLDSLDTVDALIRDADDLDAALRALAALVTGPRSVLAVWEREARNLETAQRAAIREREVAAVSRFVPLLRAERPELSEHTAHLVARAVLGALGSRRRHRISLPRRRHEQLMLDLGRLVAFAPLPTRPAPEAPTSVPAGPPPGVAGGGLRRGRREQLLTEAIRLFDERSYQSVTMTDIGEAAGIVASGVYRYFPSKTDLLVAAVNRGSEQLRAATETALAQTGDSREVLTRLLRAHIAISLEQTHLIGILANERDQLPDKERNTLRRLQSDYLNVWVQALGNVLPERETPELKVIVHAAHGMIYFTIRVSGTDPWPDLPQRLSDLGLAMLTGARNTSGTC